jgi:Xaa-Pro dipeptidase
MADYESILKGKYPAKSHAARVAEYIRSKVPDAQGVLYLESRMTKLLEDNDEAEPFRYALQIRRLSFSLAIYDVDINTANLDSAGISTI